MTERQARVRSGVKWGLIVCVGVLALVAGVLLWARRGPVEPDVVFRHVEEAFACRFPQDARAKEAVEQTQYGWTYYRLRFETSQEGFDQFLASLPTIGPVEPVELPLNDLDVWERLLMAPCPEWIPSRQPPQAKYFWYTPSEYQIYWGTSGVEMSIFVVQKDARNAVVYVYATQNNEP